MHKTALHACRRKKSDKDRVKKTSNPPGATQRDLTNSAELEHLRANERLLLVVWFVIQINDET